MKNLLVVLAVVAFLVLLVGALSHETEVSFDYLAGETPAVSLAWVGLGVAAALVLAGVAGWTVAAAAGRSARRKLEKELESTYRRLRECEARLAADPGAAPATSGATAAVPTATDDAATLAQPAADEAATVAQPAGSEPATVARQAPESEADAAEAATAVQPAPEAGTDAVEPGGARAAPGAAETEPGAIDTEPGAAGPPVGASPDD